MAISFGTSVAINNLLALKAIRTYLNNYKQHEMPRGKRGNFLSRWIDRTVISILVKATLKLNRQRFILEFTKQIVEAKSLSAMADLIVDKDARSASVSLKDVPAGMFSLLYIIQNPYLVANIKSGKELFDVISQHELEFALIKNPRESISHEPRQ